MDPFYCECRAYGRLIETSLNGRVAVRCHGYLTIPAEKERELYKRFGVEDWNRPEAEYDLPIRKMPPLRAIVKDLVHQDEQLTEARFKMILRDLKKMHRIGVYPMDVRERNYRSGLLVDMSIAMTEPHYLFDIRPAWHVRVLKREGLVSFDSMVKKSGVLTWERAVRDKEYCKKLRSYKKEK